ncbi:acyltransferase family protein [Streptomyces sp. NBC_01264]|uniref:acyltransferase family protein n=1 Tax=Streptomyces sp. NBC_01264 TaxID=2903804 RepID=UPI002259DB98|nr:acyltransferase [Streptomyces sp. NBC_01264]MCX4775290.1 acyltransferase [Streptomyces sp. NBC_01264]
MPTKRRSHARKRSDPAVLPSRLDSLTGLRFFAAFGVFMHHFTGIGNKTGHGTAPLIFPYSQMGGQGVTFFFVLSGFLLTWVHKPQERAGAFYWRRIARIWPASLVAAVPAFFVFYRMAGVRVDWGSFIASLFLVQTWLPHAQPSLPGNPVTWTLSVEVLFYALFPFVARRIVKVSTRTLTVLTAAGLVAMIVADHVGNANYRAPWSFWVNQTPVFHLPEFLVGITLALAVKRGWRMRLHPAVPVLGLCAYTYAYFQLQAGLPAYWGQQLSYTERPTIAVLSALIMLAFTQREIKGQRGLLTSRVLVNLGIWSYCFYLIHHAVIRWSTYEYGRLSDNNDALFGLLGMALVVTGLSWVLYRFVEEPANRWLMHHMPASLRRPIRSPGGTDRLPGVAEPRREPRAPVPLGYADGLTRAASGEAEIRMGAPKSSPSRV